MSADEDQAGAFWDRLGKVNSGMLGLTGTPRLVPMSHNVDAEAGVLWFITAKGTDLARDLDGGRQAGLHVVASEGDGLFASIEGVLALSEDRAKLDEIWNAVASSWFEGGQQDPDVQLVRMDLQQAEVWITGSGLRFFYEIAKSKVTGEKPDMGEHFTLTFP